MRLDGSSPATLVVEKGGRRWLASVPVTPPGGRAARRRTRQELIAAAAALAAVLAVVMAGCSSRGSPNTQASPAPVSTSPTPSPTGTATRPHKITDQELRA